MTEMMSGWWYGWAFTSLVMLMLGSLNQKIPQRLGNLRLFGWMFKAGPKSVAMNLMLCAFLWPIMLLAILLLMIDNDDSDFDNFV